MRRSSRIAEKKAETKLLRNCSVPLLSQEPNAKKNRVSLNLPADILLDVLKYMNRDGLGKIQEFLTSSEPCLLRIIIEFVYRCGNILPENLDFHLENNDTKEVLQLGYFTQQEAKEKFDVVLYKYASDRESAVVDGPALILERFTNVSS
ncbi:hypothetical protein DdX_13927 [Ditylenchus destructor]|uniref:Uncharacterized protein n=1 Tax=Ditylenchus destructor TaxID=166010 RepID=A0AAD4MVI8_9BILA|nr:hypothetical protein DdX_13927 [Ditylenchus destructor]